MAGIIGDAGNTGFYWKYWNQVEEIDEEDVCRPCHRIDAALPTADYPAKYLKPCPDCDDDYLGKRPDWWTSKNDESKEIWLDYSLWEYFHLPKALWKTEE